MNKCMLKMIKNYIKQDMFCNFGENKNRKNTSKRVRQHIGNKKLFFSLYFLPHLIVLRKIKRESFANTAR